MESLLYKMTCEGKHSKERQGKLWLTVWGVEQALLQSGAVKDTGLKDWQPKFQNNLKMVSVCLYERSHMLYLQIWIDTVKITERC